jgi:3-methyl-2-oxobutanoate hydroxymethyltransferase
MDMETKITTIRLLEMKKNGEKIAMLTGYDYGMAKLLNEAGIDVILVGDSMGMVKLGYDSTLPVTLEDILYHCKSVRRANTNALLVADMPFMSYEIKPEEAVANAGSLVKWGGVQAVKIEGGVEILPAIKAIIAAKMPVMGHLGLTPQAINQMGGYKVQGRSSEAAEKLLAAAKALEQAGVFSIVLECIPEGLAREITAALSIPTIGIGAGRYCDGQVLVLDDMLGLYSERNPRFVKLYLDLRPRILEALRQYRKEVKEGSFPAEEHSYK